MTVFNRLVDSFNASVRLQNELCDLVDRRGRVKVSVIVPLVVEMCQEQNEALSAIIDLLREKKQ